MSKILYWPLFPNMDVTTVMTKLPGTLKKRFHDIIL